MTDTYAVVGNPVAHSKSPLIHAEFARQTGQDISYDAIHAELEDFEAAVARFRDAGGRGLNVTVPFKHRAYALASRLTQRAEQAQAVNTMSFDAGAVHGDNTDGVGLVRDLTGNLDLPVAGLRVLLMGAGGAAYGACGALLGEKPALLVVANRTRPRAVELAAHFSKRFPGAPISAGAYEETSGSTFDLVINATSTGLSDSMPPLPTTVFAPGALAYEMVYGKTTPFLELAARAGVAAADGLGMLVEQAAESFFVWRGVRPMTAPVIDLLRRRA